MDTETPNGTLTGGAEIDHHIGQRIQGRRTLLRLSINSLAFKTGLSVPDIVAFESGRRRAKASELSALGNALEVGTNFFFHRFEIQAPAPVKVWLRDVDRWFIEQVSPHERIFLGLARRLTGDIESARDLVHDAYAGVLSGDTWRGLTHPRAYVLRSIYNLGLNKIRHARVVPVQQLARLETITYADGSPDAFETLAAREAAEILRCALDKLPPKCRQVMILRRIEEIPPREIARRLGVSLKAVEKHLTRGMVLLADILGAEPRLRFQAAASKSDLAGRDKPG